MKRQLPDENPLEHISMPRYSKNDIRRYSDRECEQLLKAAQDFTARSDEKTSVKWDLPVVVALSSALRRGELLRTRYDYIQRKLRATGSWTYSDSRLKVVNNFGRNFGVILQRAGIENGAFHDLRRTAICNWFEEGMSEFDVTKLAGHADFRTTHRFYLRVRDDLVHRVRQATARGLCQKLLQKCCNCPS